MYFTLSSKGTFVTNWSLYIGHSRLFRCKIQRVKNGGFVMVISSLYVLVCSYSRHNSYHVVFFTTISWYKQWKSEIPYWMIATILHLNVCDKSIRTVVVFVKYNVNVSPGGVQKALHSAGTFERGKYEAR